MRTKRAGTSALRKDCLEMEHGLFEHAQKVAHLSFICLAWTREGWKCRKEDVLDE